MTGGNADGEAERAVAELLDALEVGSGAQLPDGILKLTTDEDVLPAHTQQMGWFVYSAWKQLARRFKGRQVRGGALVRLALQGATREGVSVHVRTALDYLALWAEAGRYFTASGLAPFSFHEVFSGEDHVSGLREQVGACGSALGTRYGALMLEGMLAGIRDRRRGEDVLRAARAENPEFADTSFLDQFASTYFSRESIEGSAELIERRRTALTRDLEFLSEPGWGRRESTLLLFSCDPTYFAAHLPYWASAVQYLRTHNLGLHFMLVGGRERVAEVVGKGVEVTHSISRLRGGDPSLALERMSFSRVAVPDYVSDPMTFFACARYLLARELGQRFDGRVMILDVDMMARADPAPFLRHLHDLSGMRLPLAIGGGLASLIPARRYLAGTFPLPCGELGERVMRDLEDYVYLGLSKSISWTLDQNAITYAVEQTVARYGPGVPMAIGELEQPFVQWAAVKGIYVAEQRKLEGS